VARLELPCAHKPATFNGWTEMDGISAIIGALQLPTNIGEAADSRSTR
jgi:hypothetical protein